MKNNTWILFGSVCFFLLIAFIKDGKLEKMQQNIIDSKIVPNFQGEFEPTVKIEDAAKFSELA